MSKISQRIEALRARGFDASSRSSIKGQIRVKCSQCAACTINGVACHERGCTNQVHECKGCNNSVARAGAYCEDCR